MLKKIYKEALIIIDYQNDFINPKNGTLYIKNSEKTLNYILKKIDDFKAKNYLIIATKDWHPKNHVSFNKWPLHCIKNTKGAKLYQIDENKIDKIIKKGIDPNFDSYSAFFDDNNKSNGLDEYLKLNKVNKITILGVALDICVNATFNDAIKLNYNTIIDLNGSTGIKNIIEYKPKIKLNF